MNINSIRKYKSKISQKRLNILKLHREEYRLIQIIINNDVLLRGTVYKMAGKCGKSSCKCYKSDYSHEVWRITKSIGGKAFARVVPVEDLFKVRNLTWNYKKFQETKRNLIKIQKEIQKEIKNIEKLKSQEYYGQGIFKTK